MRVTKLNTSTKGTKFLSNILLFGCAIAPHPKKKVVKLITTFCNSIFGTFNSRPSI